MIASSYQIDFITTAGTLRLVSVGDILVDEIIPRVQQRVSDYSAIGAAWGESVADGAAKTSMSWTVRTDYASHAALRNACMRSAAGFQTGITGTLRIAITGGDSWDILDCAIASADPAPSLAGGFRTLTSYAVSGGKMEPSSSITLYAGIPWNWINQNWEDISTTWENL
jgi:hypothetical protein